MDLTRCPDCGWPMVKGDPCLHCSPMLASSSTSSLPEAGHNSRPCAPVMAIIAALVATGMFRIGIAVWEIRNALASGPGAPELVAWIAGLAGVIVGGYALSVIRSVIARHHHAAGQLVVVSVVSVLWGLWAVVILGVRLELIGVALGVFVGLLTWRSVDHFDYGAASRAL